MCRLIQPGLTSVSFKAKITNFYFFLLLLFFSHMHQHLEHSTSIYWKTSFLPWYQILHQWSLYIFSAINSSGTPAYGPMEPQAVFYVVNTVVICNIYFNLRIVVYPCFLFSHLMCMWALIPQFNKVTVSSNMFCTSQTLMRSDSHGFTTDLVCCRPL